MSPAEVAALRSVENHFVSVPTGMADLCGQIPLLLQSFDTLGLSAPLLKSSHITQNAGHLRGEMGFETPTDIQAQAIPLLLEGDRDFIGLAQTGTGKTAAFGFPLLDHLDTEWDHVQALVLAPTRELGQQIAEQLEKFAKYKKGCARLRCMAAPTSPPKSPN